MFALQLHGIARPPRDVAECARSADRVVGCLSTSVAVSTIRRVQPPNMRCLIVAALLVPSNYSLSQVSIIDLDRDGLPDCATVRDDQESVVASVWLAANGGPTRLDPDVHMSCLKQCASEFGEAVMVAPDIDMDGELELSVLSTLPDCGAELGEQVLTIFMSASGQPGFQYIGRGAPVLAAVLDARGRGQNLDELMWTVWSSDSTVGGGSGESAGSSGSGDSSGSSRGSESGSGGSCAATVPWTGPNRSFRILTRAASAGGVPCGTHCGSFC